MRVHRAEHAMRGRVLTAAPVLLDQTVYPALSFLQPRGASGRESSLGWAMVFGGPSPFLASGAPTGATAGRQQRRLRPLEEHEATKPRRCDASPEREKKYLLAHSVISTPQRIHQPNFGW